MKKQNTPTPEATPVSDFYCWNKSCDEEQCKAQCDSCKKVKSVKREGEEKWKEKFEYWLINNLQFTSKSNVAHIIDHVERYIRPATPCPLTEDELKTKFAEHLGEKELNTTDAYAVEWTFKNITYGK